MLNRNDPLIGAVQEVMRKNQAERDAIKAVNEKFGVVDRRALPHEQQANWDAAYNKVISEGVEVLNEEMSPKQKQLAAIAGNKKKIDAPDLAAARAGKAKHIEEEQIDEVLDTPGKRLKYAVKSAGSKVKARLTGDTKTADKRTSGLKMAGKKASAAVEKSKQDSVNNEIARQTLKKMAHKTGYGALYDKSGLYEEEQIDEKAPPGREDQVKALKGKVGKKSAFAIAWASYNKKKGK